MIRAIRVAMLQYNTQIPGLDNVFRSEKMSGVRVGAYRFSVEMMKSLIEQLAGQMAALAIVDAFQLQQL